MTVKDGSTAEVAGVVGQKAKRALIAAKLREHPEWADNRIAKTVGCHNETVAAVRAKLGYEIRNPDRREDVDGIFAKSKKRSEPDPAPAEARPDQPAAEQPPAALSADTSTERPHRPQGIHNIVEGSASRHRVRLPDQRFEIARPANLLMLEERPTVVR
jgi:hypothetical protein